MDRRNWTGLSRNGSNLNAYAATLMWWEVCRSRHLAITLSRDHNQLLILWVGHDIHANNRIIRTQTNTANTARRTTHWANLFLIEAYRLASRSRNNNLILTGRTADPAQFIAIIELNRNQAIRTNILIILN